MVPTVALRIVPLPVRARISTHPSCCVCVIAGGMVLDPYPETNRTMGDQKQLIGKEAVKKFKEIVDHQSICMMVTDLKADMAKSRPMSVAEVDDNGDFWFLTLRTSSKYMELAKDPRTDLYFANPSHQEFLSVNGTVEFSNDRERIKDLFSKWVEAWVPEGAEDPDLRLMKVTPEDGYYWDTKNGKILAGIKILAAMVTGSKDDGGVEGSLRA